MGQAASLIDRLHAEGIPTLLLKGAALADLHYAGAGARPMEDVDVLVPAADAHRAIDVLIAAGWAAELPSPHDRVAVHHSQPFRSPDGGAVDLHWHVMYEPGDDDECWRCAVPAKIAGVATLALCPADQLLHVCVHGIPWTSPPSVRWVADAALIVRGDQPVDWDRLVVQARARCVTLPLRAALGPLSSDFGLAVPAAILDQLAATPTSAAERSVHRMDSALPPSSPTRAAVRWWARYRRLGQVDLPYEHPRTFRGYLNQLHGFDRPWQLPARVARKVAGAVVYRAP
jgi:hypothetical protein